MLHHLSPFALRLATRMLPHSLLLPKGSSRRHGSAGLQARTCGRYSQRPSWRQCTRHSMHKALRLALDLMPPRCGAWTIYEKDVSYLSGHCSVSLCIQWYHCHWVMVAPAGGAASGEHCALAGRIRFRTAVRATTGGEASFCIVWPLPSGRRPRLGRTAAQCWTACDTGVTA